MAQVEKRLEALLQIGTWCATIVVALGVVFSSNGITQLGIGIFILIPVGRVIGLLFSFIENKDFQMTIVGTIVLIVIISSFLIGMLYKLKK